MTVRDIKAHVEEIYDYDLSKDLVSTITDGVIEEMQDKCVATVANNF
jgi:transposase-like protein